MFLEYFFDDEIFNIQLVCSTADKRGAKGSFEKSVYLHSETLLHYRNIKCFMLLSFTSMLRKPFVQGYWSKRPSVQTKYATSVGVSHVLFLTMLAMLCD
jgi:hypothetical protein